MVKVTEKSRLKVEDSRQQSEQLIESLKQLKEIKPRKEWAILLKSQILADKQIEIKVPERQAKSIGIMDIFSSLFFQRKLAYAFAVVLFLIVGVFGFAEYTMPGDLLFPMKKIAEQSQASLTGQPGLVATFNNRINELAQVAKDGRIDNMPSAIDEIKINASELAKNLKDNPAQDPQIFKDIAISLKTLANVPGTDLSENQSVKDLYQAVAQNQIADLEKTTLTEDQKNTLTEIKDLYFQEKYTDALEKILLINDTN